VLASLTFDLDIDPEQAEAMKLVISGLSDNQICERLGITSKQLDGRFVALKLEKGIDLVQATRGRLVTWDFQR
jgi:hypothetical protein